MSPFLKTLPCILAAVTLVQASSIRGVSPDRQHLYQATNGQWECLDHSKILPYSAINDDYCDCPDGSDEPGTSACPNSYFFCENKGHIPAYIKSYAVNDGVCDEACCDGSDETSGLISCPNVCKQQADDYAKIKAATEKILADGGAAKRKLIEDGLDTVSKWQEEKSKLEDEIVIQKAALLRYQQEIDVLEAEAGTFQNASKKKKKCPPCDVDVLSEHIKTLEAEIDSLVTILQNLKRDHNHNYHDMAVKAAITSYEDFLEGYEELKAEIDKDLVEDAIDGFVEEVEEEEEEEAEQNKQEDHLEPAKKQGKESIVYTLLEKVGNVIPSKWKELVSPSVKTAKEDESTSNPTSRALDAARSAYNGVEDEIKSLERKLETVNEDLKKDYGERHEWLKLKDVCAEKNEGEYTYSVCLFGNAYQKSNKDGARINLGRFDKFLNEKHDEQLYSHGTKCWNGPERSVHATFECGGQTEILEVTEPEKCEYRYRMKTPAVCPLPEDQVKNDNNPFIPSHEEL
ncbi:glucosidase II beta subunit-like-domain-containing protein [Dichotomocladium elegans]|nr:glucosidase II beta subunit-like-domain-containing protein [Dichotomocladium elegans]